MKITKNKLRQLVNESYSSEAAYQAGYEDARRGRRHGDNPQMRNLDPRQYDRGFDMGTADNASDRRRPDDYDRRISDGKIMITKEQLRSIIKESLMSEGVLYVDRHAYGMSVEDDDGNYITIGEMVLDLIDSGDTDIFKAAQGVDPESLQRLQQKHAEGVQGGMQRWDSDVFGDYYNVDNDRVLRLYARLKNHRIQEESDEDDGTNEFEEYYS